MRIISGSAKGVKLLSPIGMNTRPTLDRVKEAIFNIIQNHVYDRNCIDVFAGTGSLGLEAVSRGAKSCILIDRDKDTFKILTDNVAKLKFTEKCNCINKDSYLALNELGSNGNRFDLIFIDPPYCKELIPPAINIISEKNMLNEGGIIASKIDSSEKIYEGNDNIELVYHKKYGNTTICFYKRREE